MSAAWLSVPGAACVGLLVMMWRRLISPTRFAQALGGLALGTLAVVAAAQVAGGPHG